LITERAGSKSTSEQTSPCRPPSGRAVTRRKRRVDEVHRLDLADLRRAGALGRSKPGTMTIWSSETQLGPAGGASMVHFVPELSDNSDNARLVLAHERGRGHEHGDPKPVVYAVGLTATPCPFGGARWWFRCPLVVDGAPCGRRCRILYRPYGAPYFGCRECWGLTYRCRQLHRNLRFEGWTRAEQLLEEIRRNPWPRSKRKRARRLERMVRTNRALERFTGRLRARAAG
jgi:hypothetical protein